MNKNTPRDPIPRHIRFQRETISKHETWLDKDFLIIDKYSIDNKSRLGGFVD